MAQGHGHGGGGGGSHGGGGNGGGNGGGGGGGTNAGQGGVGQGQPTGGLPAWLTSGNGGTGAPIPVSAWLSPDYPGGYAGWLNDHPNAGHDATPPDNPVYRSWLQQHVGSDGQLHLPPAGSPGTSVSDTGSGPTPNPAANPGVGQPGTDQNPGPNQHPQAPGGGAVGTDQNPGPHQHPQAPGGGTLGVGDQGNGGTTAPVPKTPLGGGSFGTGGQSGNNSSQSGGISIPHGKSSGGIAPPDPGKTTPGGYTVLKGDTMWGIAKAHGISLQQLEAMNPQIKDPSLILPGQQVNLGGAATGPIESPPAGSGQPPVPLPGGGTTGGATGPVESPPAGSGQPPVPLPGAGGNTGGTGNGTTGPIESPPLGSNHPPVHLPGGGGSTSDGNQLIDPAIHGPHNQITGGGSTRDGNQLVDPAIHGPHNQITGGGATDTHFPTSSTYPPTDSNTSQSALSKLKAKVRGWSNGTGSVPTDPATRAVIVSSNEDTNPLHIRDQNGPHNA